MTIFQAEQISKVFSDKTLFKHISFGISQGDKVAIIARNGSGKTTLLNIIAGLDQPDEGSCSFKTGLRIAYLKQEPDFDPEIKVSQALLHTDTELTNLIREYEEFTESNADTNDINPNKLQELVERMDSLGAWDFEQRIKQILTRLKIGNMNMKVGQLSGGQKKRLALAGILIDDADFILMDEPTNHLDLEMTEWLEGFLSRKKQSLLLVTHDRYFLDAVCNGIIELDQGILYNYRGNYSHFLQKKHERLSNQETQTTKAVNLLRKESEWMKRSPKARTTKSKARIDSFYDLKEKASIQGEQQMDSIKVDMTRLGKKILELVNVSKKYDDNLVIDSFSYVFKRGERVGIVGPNGCGKTSLLNIITENTDASDGKVVKGETIQFGYYKQDGLQIDNDKRVIDVITDISESISLGEGRVMTASQLLHYFNFTQASQYDKAAKLSGGEKRRLYLLTVLMKNPNFLILDEPTNDFDINTLNVLEEYLKSFEGCLVIVSHDRYFLDNIVDHLFVFQGSGKIKDFTGNYTDYRLKMEKSKPVTVKAAKEKEAPAKTVKTKSGKLSFKEQQEYTYLESHIEELEKEKSGLLDAMNSGKLPQDELLECSIRFQKLEQELEEKTDRWLQLSERT